MNKASIFIIPVIFGTVLLVTACNQKSNNGQSSKQTSSVQENVQASAIPANNQQLCEVHKAPKGVCFICDASLRDPKRLWCKEHNRYEDRCFICHPEAQDKSKLYCTEHGLYEEECMICHPEITKG